MLKVITDMVESKVKDPRKTVPDFGYCDLYHKYINEDNSTINQKEKNKNLNFLKIKISCVIYRLCEGRRANLLSKLRRAKLIFYL